MTQPISNPNLESPDLSVSEVEILPSDSPNDESITSLTPPELDADYADFEQFDWEGFARDSIQKNEEQAEDDTEEGVKQERAILQSWMAPRLDTNSLEVLLKDVPVKSLWEWLSQKEHLIQRAQMLRGFQQTPQILRNPAVKSRLLKYFEKERQLILVLLLLWGERERPHPLTILLNDELEDTAIIKRLPTIFKEFSPQALLCAAAYNGRPLLFKLVHDFILSPTELFEQPVEEIEVDSPTLEETEIEIEEALPSNGEHLALKAELEHARENIARLNAHNEILTTQNKTLQKENAALKAHEKQLATQWEKKFELGLKKAASEIAELKRHDERQTRRLNKTEREREELETDLKRTKKQLRNTQQLLEAEKKNHSLLNAKPTPVSSEVSEETAAPAKETPKSRQKTTPATPLDEIFEWQADGRRIAVSPRQARKYIDQNDEEALYGVQMALEVLQTKNRELYNRFLHRLGTIDASYKRVLSAPTQRVLVDASNVARSEKVKGRGKLKLLISARDELRRLGAWPIILVADASLRHNIDEGKKFQEMIDNGEIIQSDKGVEADEILAREARRTGASVVTNDARFFHKVSPDFEPPRIPFKVFEGTVLIDEI